MLKTISTAALGTLSRNYKDTKNLASETDSAAIELNHLEDFIRQARANLGSSFNAIKVYFIRYELDADQDHITKIPDQNLSQVSLALVPGTVTDPVAWTVKNLPLAGDKFTLLVCAPANVRGSDDKTGICQPKCDSDGE